MEKILYRKKNIGKTLNRYINSTNSSLSIESFEQYLHGQNDKSHKESEWLNYQYCFNKIRIDKIFTKILINIIIITFLLYLASSLIEFAIPSTRIEIFKEILILFGAGTCTIWAFYKIFSGAQIFRYRRFFSITLYIASFIFALEVLVVLMKILEFI